ncbi:hypothetical protein [Streptomyces sp. NPDC021356]|uniref:hypothetical protein n=1 Tax=Streptomyces sp. NPDC021356 TaxID=3154900 RepID=UPI0033C4180C
MAVSVVPLGGRGREFGSFMDHHGEQTVTVAATLGWVTSRRSRRQPRRRSLSRRGRQAIPLTGLPAASGLRIGEAIKLDRDDIDWAEGVLHIRESESGESRLSRYRTAPGTRCASTTGSA